MILNVQAFLNVLRAHPGNFPNYWAEFANSCLISHLELVYYQRLGLSAFYLDGG